MSSATFSISCHTTTDEHHGHSQQVSDQQIQQDNDRCKFESGPITAIGHMVASNTVAPLRAVYDHRSPHLPLHPLLSANGRRVLGTSYVLAVITLIFFAATVFTDAGTVHYGPEEHDLIEHELPVALRLGPSEFADEVPATRTRGCER